jgi:hypothetical protein
MKGLKRYAIAFGMGAVTLAGFFLVTKMSLFRRSRQTSRHGAKT